MTAARNAPDTVRMLQMVTNRTKMMPGKMSKSVVPTTPWTVPYSAPASPAMPAAMANTATLVKPMLSPTVA